jgi:hypothetical protein
MSRSSFREFLDVLLRVADLLLPSLVTDIALCYEFCPRAFTRATIWDLLRFHRTLPLWQTTLFLDAFASNLLDWLPLPT